MFEFINVFDFTTEIDKNDKKTWILNWENSFINNFRQQGKVMQPIK